MKRDYFEKADIAVTVCDREGKILDMNCKSRRTFLKPGQPEIIGQNVLGCHPEPARSQLADMLANPAPTSTRWKRKASKSSSSRLPGTTATPMPATWNGLLSFRRKFPTG